MLYYKTIQPVNLQNLKQRAIQNRETLSKSVRAKLKSYAVFNILKNFNHLIPLDN